MGSKVPDPCSTCGFKGMSAPARLQYRAAVSAKHPPMRVRPSKTGTYSCNASIFVEYRNLQCPHAVISSGHVRHIG
jgi:hypothetical protein